MASEEKGGQKYTIATGLASKVILVSKSRRTLDDIFGSQIEDSPYLEAQVSVFYLARRG
jgi:hypothetical protein